MAIVTVRAAVPDDYDNLCLLIDQGDALHRKRLPRIFRKPEGPVREKEHLLALMKNEETAIFVAEIDGRPAGYLNILVTEAKDIPVMVPRRYAVVDQITVDARYRRLGIGRALMEQAERWALEIGAASVELNVYEFNQEAIEFYRALGYKTASRRMRRRLD